jgi:hypothetical protein
MKAPAYAAVRAAGYPRAADAVRNRTRVLLASVDSEYPVTIAAAQRTRRGWM